MFFRLLLESFRRQRRRKLLAGVAILLGATAVTAMLALATTIGDRIHSELAVFGANIVVTPKAANLDVKIGGADIQPATGNAYLHESDLAKLQTIFWANNITGISPELLVPTEASLNRKSSTVGQQGIHVEALGLWFKHPLSSTLVTGAPALHPWWKLQGSWPSGTNQVAVGSALAAKFQLLPGDFVTIPEYQASSDTRKLMAPVYTITGVVSTADANDGRLLVPLVTAQRLANLPDAVSRVEISAITMPEDASARRDSASMSPKDHEIWYCRAYANSIAYNIQEALPGSDAQQVRRVEQSEGVVLARISGLMWLICAAALLAAGFAVSAAMATAILERRAEIGLMRSLGAAKYSIALLFYAETGLLAIFAGALGYVLGSGLAAWLGARIFAGSATAAPATTHFATFVAAFNPVLLPVVIGLALLVAIGGSTPAIRAALRLDPATILRSDA
jgi:putative ABC transport system permease protein